MTKKIVNLNAFPKSRIKGYDGMSVTAEAWEKAHAEHRDSLKAHALFFHGAGIISGLEVTANDPPDHYVFISAGAAIDANGQIILVDQTVAYDFGEEGEGEYILFLGYGEREIGGSEDAARYVQNEFILAARLSLPKRPVVELARISISRKGNFIRNASNPLRPVKDEIDLRFRLDAENPNPLIHGAIVPLGPEILEIAAGWEAFRRESRMTKRMNLVLDINTTFSDALNNHSFVYLYAFGNVNITDAHVKALKNYLANGGHLFLEGIDNNGANILMKLAEDLGISRTLNENSPMMAEPHFFRIPPDGIDGEMIRWTTNAVFSGSRIAVRWSGMADGKPMKREEIRSCFEWGMNVLRQCGLE